MQCRRAPGVWGLPGPLLGPGRPTRPGGREGERGLSWSRWRGGGRGVGRTSERVARVLLRGGALQLLVDERGVLDEGLELDRRHARPAAGMPAVSPPLPRRGMRRGEPGSPAGLPPPRRRRRRAGDGAGDGAEGSPLPSLRRDPPPPAASPPACPAGGLEEHAKGRLSGPNPAWFGVPLPLPTRSALWGGSALWGAGAPDAGGGFGNPEEPGRPPKAPARARKEQCEGSV